MKNTIIAILFLLGFSLNSMAQFKIGIKAGGNYTNVLGKTSSGDKAEGHTFVPSFHVGLLAEYDVSEFISLQSEAVYTNKGFMLKNTKSTSIALGSITSETKALYTISYIDVPLLVNIHFGQMGSYVGLGPQLSFLSGVKWDGTITNTSTITTPPSSTTTELTFAGNDKTGFSKVDFGAVIGTGSKWESGIEYCLRAGYGLTNVIDPANSASDELWHNLYFTVSLGYTFNIGGGGGGDRYGHKYKKRR